MKKIFLGLLIILVIGGIYFYYLANKTGEYRETNWEKIGYAVKNNPGMQEDVLYVIYEEPGSPALSTQLRIDDKTVCYDGDDKIECNESNILGKRIEVHGHNDNGIILVNDLIIASSQ